MRRLTIAGLVAALSFTVSGTPLSAGLAGPYLAARQASMLSDYDEAAAYYRRAMAQAPQNLSLMESAMIALLGKGDVPAAIGVAQRHARIGGTHPVAHVLLNVNELAQDQYDRPTQPSDDENGIAPLLDGLVKAWAHLGQGQMTDATEAFGKVAKIADFASFAHYHQALALAVVGDFEGADEILSGRKHGTLVLSTRGIEAHAQILAQLERTPDAIELLDAAMANGFSPDLNALRETLQSGTTPEYNFVTTPQEGAAEVYFNIAAILNGRAAPEFVLIYARMAQYLRPDHVPAILAIAETLDENSQYDLATAAFAEVPKDHPAYFMAELGRSDAFYADDRKDEAVDVLRALSQSHGEIAMVHAALGDMLGRVKDDDGAIAAYTTSIEMRADDDRSAWPVYYARGITHERNDRLPEMERDFRRALELNPDQPDVLNYLGYSLVEQKVKLDEALAMIEKAVELRPQSGYITDSLAWVFYRLGRYDEAVAPMEKAVELLPVDPIVNDHLGDVYWKVGREREAEFQWKRALSFEPEEAEADRIRRKLEIGLDEVLLEEAAGGTPTASEN
jgi:tetratricopeptide (TPR) repeat protein